MPADGKLNFDTSMSTVGFETGLATINGLVDNAVQYVMNAVKNISSKLITATKEAVNVGTGFEASMSKVSAISGAQGDELSLLTQKAKEMGASTKFSASESAEAFQYMAMAGWDTQKMLDGIDGIMSLSAADGLDLATTSDIVTDALTAFGLSADESSHFADVLATASSSANTNVAMLGESFKYVAPLAGAMKYKAEDVSLALGLMANSSVKGSMAGTSLKTALANLTSPTTEMQKALEKLGLAASKTSTEFDQLAIDKAVTNQKKAAQKLTEAQEKYNTAVQKYGQNSTEAQKAATNLETAQNSLTEANEKLTKAQQGTEKQTDFVVTAIQNADGSTKPLKETIIELRKAFANLDEAQQTEYASTIFGKEAMSGMLAIINASDDDFNKLVDNLANADGAAKNMADTMNDNLQGDITIMNSALEGLGIKFYETFNDKLRETVKLGTSYIDEMSKALTEGGIEGAVEKIVEIFGDVSVKIIDYIPNMVNAAEKLIQALRDNLIRLLPSSVREPVKKAVSGIDEVLKDTKKIFKDVFTSKDIKSAVDICVGFISGFVKIINDTVKRVLPSFSDGLKKIKNAFARDSFRRGVESAKKVIESFARTLEMVSKTTIPIVCEVLGFLAEHLDVLVPLIATAVIAFGTWSALQGVINITKTAITAIQGLGTAMMSIPGVQVVAIIGTIVTALTILATWLATATGNHAEYIKATERMKEQEEKTVETANDLADALENVGGSCDDFIKGIDDAKSSLEGIDDSIIMDRDKFDKLTKDLSNLQTDFNKIAGTYSDERKKLTQSEIDELENLLVKMREISNEQLELLKGYQSAASTQATMFVEQFSGSVEEYTEESKSYIKGAIDSKNKVIEAAKEQYKNEIANIGKMKGLSESERRRKNKEAKQAYDDAVTNAEKECNDTLQVIMDGYNSRSNAAYDFLKESNQYYQEYIKNQKNLQENLKRVTNVKDIDVRMQQINRATESFQKNQENSLKKYVDNFDETKQKQLGTWLGMLKIVQDNGGKIDQETANMVFEFLRIMDELPPESKQRMQSTIDSMKKVYDKLPDDMKKTAEKSSNAWIKGSEDLPERASRVTNDVKNQILSKLGEIPKGAEEKANKMADTLAREIPSSANLEKVNAAAERIRIEVLNGLSKQELFEECGRNMLRGYLTGLNDNPFIPSTVGAGIVNNTMNSMAKAADMHSPSRKTKKQGINMVEGFVIGIKERTKKASEASALMTAQAIQNISNSLRKNVTATTGNKSRFSDIFRNTTVSDITQRLKNAVSVHSFDIGNVMTAKSTVGQNKSEGTGNALMASGTVETHINIDGREFAVVTAPFIDEELAFLN